MKLKPMYEDEMSGLIRRSDELDRLRHLRLHRIADAKIQGIGNERKSRLEYYGILTAADVNEDTVRGVIGFGEVYTARLLGWRDHVIRAFRPRGIKGIPADSLRQLVVRYRDLQQRLLSEATRSTRESEDIVAGLSSPRTQYISEVTSVLGALDQAEVDYQHLEMFEPTLVN
jgi:DNA-binding helix-hairpin-helix protein with protein kinase domain